jgi:hypothetical protein
MRDHLGVLSAFAFHLARGVPARALTIPATDIAYICEWPEFAFDPFHTRSGRRAVQILASEHARGRYTGSEIAACLWQIESAVCDPVLAWQAGAEIKAEAQSAELQEHGFPPERRDELVAWIADHRPQLHDARLRAWNAECQSRGGLA